VEHVVFFPAPDGSPAFRRVAGLEDAVRLVEHLRNVEGVAEVSIHPLGAEVPLAFRTWYRVEVPAAELVPAVPEQTVPEPELELAPVAEPVRADAVPAEPVAEPPTAEEPAHAAANGHGADLVPNLGFFAT
jgi:hypothetical protein